MMQDPFGSFNGMIGQLKGFVNNPIGFMAQRKLNIPQQYLSNPNTAIQYMMNSGMLSQEQYDWAVREAQKIQNNPQFMQMFKK